MADLLKAIHGVTNRDSITKNALWVHIKRAQCVDRAFSGEVMSITAPKRGQNRHDTYEPHFTDKDIYGVNAPHNDALVLVVNINTFNVKYVLINPGSSSEIMYYSMFKELHAFTIFLSKECRYASV